MVENGGETKEGDTTMETANGTEAPAGDVSCYVCYLQCRFAKIAVRTLDGFLFIIDAGEYGAGRGLGQEEEEMRSSCR